MANKDHPNVHVQQIDENRTRNGTLSRNLQSLNISQDRITLLAMFLHNVCNLQVKHHMNNIITNKQFYLVYNLYKVVALRTRSRTI